jgi:hypothetical protein
VEQFAPLWIIAAGALLGAELFHTCGDGGLVTGAGKNSPGNSSRV